MPKKCRKCNRLLNLNDFYKHRAKADGYLSFCKECVKNRVREHRRLNDSVRAYDRARSKTPERKAHLQKNSSVWRKNNPEKYKAQTAVNNAIRDGKLVKRSCEECGSQKVHAHHDDYSKPLTVRWLCALHHHRYHAANPECPK